MNKRVLAVLLCIALFLCPFPPVHAAEGNMDGDGGDMGAGESGVNSWSPGYDGIRVTVVNKNTLQVSGTPFDWSTVSVGLDTAYSFSKRNKSQYLNGASLAPIFGSYQYFPAPPNMPTVVSSDGSSNIAAVKSFFTDEGTVRAIAEDASLSYDALISGDFVIMLEPIAYYTYNSIFWAMTATEAALYDRQIGGGLRSKMGLLTHQNLPLSMYLERTELGIPPWSGGSGVISNENILAYLGVGTVRFDGDEDEEMPTGGDEGVAEYDYTYHAGTDVVTAVWIDNNGGKITPDHGATARFNIPGQSAVSKSYVIPAGESQLVWVKWTTPSEETTMEITVTASRGSPQKNTIRVKIVDLVEDTPPDPDGRDRNDTFRLVDPPTGETVTSLSWGEWYAWWKSKWVYVSYEDEKGSWEDQGDWEFGWNSYSASLLVEAKLKPDEKVPTATERYGVYTMKSAYGVNADIATTFSTTGGAGNTSPVQHVIAVFPEFEYKTYNRLLEADSHTSTAYRNSWQFQKNEYSRFYTNVHFTPIWYPDEMKYPVAFTILDAWTPAGQLQATVVADNIIIEGNVYDDWHIAPGFASVD